LGLCSVSVSVEQLMIKDHQIFKSIKSKKLPAFALKMMNFRFQVGARTSQREKNLAPWPQSLSPDAPSRRPCFPWRPHSRHPPHSVAASTWPHRKRGWGMPGLCPGLHRHRYPCLCESPTPYSLSCNAIVPCSVCSRQSHTRSDSAAHTEKVLHPLQPHLGVGRESFWSMHVCAV
jgi:hypothetical protein